MSSTHFKFITLLLISSGCVTSLSSSARNVRDADENTVSNCEFVGTFQGSSGWGDFAAGTGMQNSKNQILELAARQGATHVVFQHVHGGYSPSASARGYRCNSSQ